MNNQQISHTDTMTQIISTDNITAAIISEILTQNNIPFYKEGSLDIGIVAYMGSSTERFDIFVPNEYIETSKELLSNFLE